MSHAFLSFEIIIWKETLDDQKPPQYADALSVPFAQHIDLQSATIIFRKMEKLDRSRQIIRGIDAFLLIHRSGASMRRRRNGSSATGLAGGRIPLISLLQMLAVAEHLNFRHAANMLGTTQSSVSARIKGLEDALGIVLFERRHRGVRLTEAGRHFAAEVSAGIAQLDHAVRTAGAMVDGAEGHLAIGLHSSIAAGFLADLRRQFRASYPIVEQSVLEGRSSEMIAMVLEGRLDVAFVVGGVNAPDCHSCLMWCEPIVVALPTDHPLAERKSISWLDLADQTFLVRHGGTGPQVFEHVVRRIGERKRSPRIHRCDVARDTLMGMVAAGDGITLTSEATTHVSFPGVVFRLIFDETETALFSAVWSPHNRNPALVNLLDLAMQMSRSAPSA